MSMSKTLEKEMNQSEDTLEYFKRLAEQPISQEVIDEMNERLEQRDEIEKLHDAIEHYEADLRYHAKQVRRDTVILEERIKRILKERGDI